MPSIHRTRFWLVTSLTLLSLMLLVLFALRHTEAQDQSLPEKKPDGKTRATTIPSPKKKPSPTGVVGPKEVVSSIPLTPKTLRSEAIGKNSIVDVFYERRDPKPDEERSEKLFADIKVHGFVVQDATSPGPNPSAIELILSVKQADTLKTVLESEQCDLFVMLAEAEFNPRGDGTDASEKATPKKNVDQTAPVSSPSGGGFGGSGPPGGNFYGAGFGFQQNQSNPSTLVFQNDVVALPKELIGGQPIVQGALLAITSSRNNDMLWGYSEPLGKWVKQPVKEKVTGLSPIVGGSVAAIQPSHETPPDFITYYAFSAPLGRWASLRVSANASPPVVAAKMVIVTDGETTHVFKNDTGKWSSPTARITDNDAPSEPTKVSGDTDAEGQPDHTLSEGAPPKNKLEADVRKLAGTSYVPPYARLPNGQPVFLVDVDGDGEIDVLPVAGMKSPHNYEDHSFVGAWQMTKESARRRNEAEQELVTIEKSFDPTHPAFEKLNERLAALRKDENEWRMRLKAFAPPATFERRTVKQWIARMKSDLQQTEAEAQQAARIVAGQKTPDAKGKDQVLVAVRKVFDARQALQRFEADLQRHEAMAFHDRLQQLDKKLQAVDHRLEERDRLRDRIIERRVDDLTNANLDWGTSEPLELSKHRDSPPSDTAATNKAFHGVLYFNAAMNGPCEKMNPIISKLKKEGLPINRFDVYDKDQLVQKMIESHQVTVVPILIAFAEGVEVERIEGVTTEERVRSLIEAIPSEKRPKPKTPSATVVPPNQSDSKKPFRLLSEPITLDEPATSDSTPVRRQFVKAKPEFEDVFDETPANPPTDVVVKVNDKPITYRDLVRMGLTLGEVEGAINFVLIKQAAEKASITVSEKEIDAESQRKAG